MLAHLRVDRLLFPEPVAAGMNPYVLFSLTHIYRSTNEDVEPIQVRTYGLGGLYTITDGRHRSVASMIAGRKTVLADIEE